MPAVPGFVNEDGAMGKRTPTAGAVAEFGCAGHDDHVAPGAMETAMAPLGAGPTPAPELGTPISNSAISPGQGFLQGGIRTAPTPQFPLQLLSIKCFVKK